MEILRSSDGYRKLFIPMLSSALIEKGINSEILEIISLQLFLFTEVNLKKIIRFIESGEYSKCKSIAELPNDFDTYLYHIGEVLFIVIDQKNYFIVISEDERIKDYPIVLEYVLEIKQLIDFSKFQYHKVIL